MHIEIEDLQDCLPISKSKIISIVKAVIAFENKHCDEVGIHFVDKQEISELHRIHFNDPTPTDCISFPLDGVKSGNSGLILLGDVFICPEVAVEYVKEHGGDSYHELYLYIVHGLLHLMGYDDIDEKDCAEMRKAESRHLKNLEIQDLL